MQAVNVNSVVIVPIHQATFQRFSQTLAIIYSNRKAPVIKTALPEASLLSTKQPYDYSDGYLTTFKDASDEIEAEDVAYALYSAAPIWMKVLLAFRNRMATFLHLKKTVDPLQKKSALKQGGNFRFFDVLHKSDNEIVYGKNGKHIDIRHSLLLHKPKKHSVQKNVMVSTAVTFHTRTGRLYFITIKPVLKYIVPLLVKRTVEHLEA